MNKDDGGLAFPNAPLYSLQEEDGIYELLVDEQSSGMTLRDYFAAKAMQSGIFNSAVRGSIYECSEMAKFAYDMADAMLKAREA